MTEANEPRVGCRHYEYDGTREPKDSAITVAIWRGSVAIDFSPGPILTLVFTAADARQLAALLLEHAANLEGRSTEERGL